MLVIGLLVALLLGRLVRSALVRLGVDRFAERTGTHRLLSQAGLGSSLSRLLGTAVRLSVAVVAVFASLSLLGFQFLSQSLNAGVLFIPQLLVALALLLIGLVVGAFVRAWVEHTTAQLDFPLALAPVSQIVVIALFALCAAAQAGVATEPLTAIAALLLGAVAITFALAFGFGSREVARALSSGRYVRADFDVGQTIRIGDLRGTIIRMDGAATTLRSGAETIRVPNHLLVERIVVVEAPPESM